jgi:hypothetical protein
MLGDMRWPNLVCRKREKEGMKHGHFTRFTAGGKLLSAPPRADSIFGAGEAWAPRPRLTQLQRFTRYRAITWHYEPRVEARASIAGVI